MCRAPSVRQSLLPPLGVDSAAVDAVCEVITRIGFKDELPSSNDGAGAAPARPPLSREAQVVQVSVRDCWRLGSSDDFECTSCYE